MNNQIERMRGLRSADEHKTRGKTVTSLRKSPRSGIRPRTRTVLKGQISKEAGSKYGPNVPNSKSTGEMNVDEIRREQQEWLQRKDDDLINDQYGRYGNELQDDIDFGFNEYADRKFGETSVPKDQQKEFYINYGKKYVGEIIKNVGRGIVNLVGGSAGDRPQQFVRDTTKEKIKSIIAKR